jgi:excisionase family DNA binding protein
MQSEKKRYLTVEQIAARFNRAPKTVHDWIGAKKIPHIKMPTGGVLFDEAEIDEWVAQHHVPAGESKPKRAA